MRFFLFLATAGIIAAAAVHGQTPATKPVQDRVAPTQVKAESVTPACFAVEKFKASVVDKCIQRHCYVLNLTGKLRNNCIMAAGANLKITAEDKNGAVVDTTEGWPASISNVAPGSGYSFNLGPLMDYQSNMAKFTVEVIDAKIWHN